MGQFGDRVNYFYTNKVAPFLKYINIHFLICCSLMLDNLGKYDVFSQYLPSKKGELNVEKLEKSYQKSKLSFSNGISDLELGRNVYILPGLIKDNELEFLAIKNNRHNFFINGVNKTFQSENIEVIEELNDKKFDTIIIGPHFDNRNSKINETVDTYRNNLTDDGSLYYETLMYYPNDNKVKESLQINKTFTFENFSNTVIPSFIEVASNPYKIVDINDLYRYINKDYVKFTNSFFDNDRDIYKFLMTVKMYAKNYRHPLMFVRMKIN